MFSKCFLSLFAVFALANFASAEFIIDSFNASSTIATMGVGEDIIDGVNVERSYSTFAGSFTAVENGTSVTYTAGGAGAIFDVNYAFTGGTGSGAFTTSDLLGGDAGLKLDFLNSNSDSVGIQYSVDNGVSFSGGALGFGPSTTAFSVSFATPDIIGATVNSLTLRFSNFNAGTSFTLDRLTATPEPTSLMLVGSCVGLFGLRRRRKEG